MQSLYQSSEPFAPDIVPLKESDLPALRLHLHSRLREEEAVSAVRTLPGLSQWHPRSGEYVLVAPWRHRDDIISLRDVSAFYHEKELIAAVMDAADEQGFAACITAETFERRRPVFYSRNGMDLFEEIYSYRHHRVMDFLDAVVAPIQEFVVVDVADEQLLRQVIDVDHASFTWLWRNQRAEFLAWMSERSTEVWAGMIDGQVVSYYGTTLFQKLGHLDRIAVHPDWQGKGLGAETLTVAMQRFANLGLPEAMLSTQADNATSQRLYEKAGFRHRESEDYHVYGTLLSAVPQEWEFS